MNTRHDTKQNETHGTEPFRLFQQRRTHSSLQTERFRTTAVEADTGDVLLNDLERLCGKFGRGGTELEDETRFLDGVAVENRATTFDEGHDAGLGCDSRETSLVTAL